VNPSPDACIGSAGDRAGAPRREARPRPGLGVLLLLVFHACTPSSRAITRIYDGVEVRGPRIPPEAYAAFTEGAVLEAAGDLSGSRAAYERALAEHDASPELWTRFASVSCRLGNDSVDAAFAPALRVDPNHGPAWTEMARCHLAREQVPAALRPALRGATLAPEDEEATRTVVQALERRGETARAARWATAWRLAHPGHVVPLPEDPPEVWLVRVDEALREGDLERARQHAARARVSAGELALRAAVRGRTAAAVDQAELVLRADPSSADAWVARLVAADLSGDEAALRAALVALDAPEPLSPAAIAALTDLLHRRAGHAAAEAFRSALGSPAAAP
jgi:tetratricopeptide (TPR) repeat protein